MIFGIVTPDDDIVLDEPTTKNNNNNNNNNNKTDQPTTTKTTTTTLRREPSFFFDDLMIAAEQSSWWGFVTLLATTGGLVTLLWWWCLAHNGTHSTREHLEHVSTRLAQEFTTGHWHWHDVPTLFTTTLPMPKRLESLTGQHVLHELHPPQTAASRPFVLQHYDDMEEDQPEEPTTTTTTSFASNAWSWLLQRNPHEEEEQAMTN